MVLNRILLICLVIISFPSYSFIELSGNFSYQKQVYGADDQNDSISRTYAASVAWYFSTLTALEFNYSVSKEDTTSRDTLNYDELGISIVKMVNNVSTDVYGIGIRQSFAPHDAFIRPLLSIGYAKQVEKSSQTVTFEDNSSKEQAALSYPQESSDYDSVFATFSLQFQITRLLSLKGSVNTLFPAFKFDEAKNNVKYLAGFSWAF